MRPARRRAERDPDVSIACAREWTGERRSSLMRIYWLATTAVALVIGTGPVLAQPLPSHPQKQDEHRAQSLRPDRAAQSELKGRAGEAARDQHQAADRANEHADRPDSKSSAAGPVRGQSAAESKQAQEPRHDSKQRQSEKQPGSNDTHPSGQAAQQNQDQQKRAKQASESKQRQD